VASRIEGRPEVHVSLQIAEDFSLAQQPNFVTSSAPRIDLSQAENAFLSKFFCPASDLNHAANHLEKEKFIK
jgi:hypothetical protein